ncbi:hypothetical protein MMC28_009307 [Mycoblastus sanguinarius]|nr:hypothetical protein [Mycoblastus sanguinarius]
MDFFTRSQSTKTQPRSTSTAKLTAHDVLADIHPVPTVSPPNTLEAILQNCLPGPAITVFVGPSATQFTIPKRLFLHYSPEKCVELLIDYHHSKGPNTIELLSQDPDAFNHLLRWMLSGRLSVLAHLLTPESSPATPSDDAAGSTGVNQGRSIEKAMSEACGLLTRIYALVISLRILGSIHNTIFTEIDDVLTRSRDMSHATPLSASIVLETYRRMNEHGKEYCELWEVVLTELCTAFSGKPKLHFAHYAECFQKIPGLNEVVLDALHDRIHAGDSEDVIEATHAGNPDDVKISSRRQDSGTKSMVKSRPSHDQDEANDGEVATGGVEDSGVNPKAVELRNADVAAADQRDEERDLILRGGDADIKSAEEVEVEYPDLARVRSESKAGDGAEDDPEDDVENDDEKSSTSSTTVNAISKSGGSTEPAIAFADDFLTDPERELVSTGGVRDGMSDWRPADEDDDDEL